MNKIILSVCIALALLSVSAYAQEAILHADGSQEIRVTDASGKVTSVTLAKGESLSAKHVANLQQQQAGSQTVSEPASKWVSHQAVLRADGTQEIHMTDASGKETVITAAKGESVQAKYLQRLTKEGIPCNCSDPAKKASETTKTATRPTKVDPNSK
ncbi:MAG: hypothetical protein Q8916_13175 [Bacteroidota bacterium]|nr:hypothetical protein [Bacteroidota bacterium]MDP4231344.1 hypothetical protein [Bacteroidota bacterium]MDP4236537.1 hypothetical protein [Bacteroidota bacterium]